MELQLVLKFIIFYHIFLYIIIYICTCSYICIYKYNQTSICDYFYFTLFLGKVSETFEVKTVDLFQ